LTVEPKQMSGQPDTSDDLIAELAKLMATNAKPEPTPAPAPKPAQTASAPIPIRIPGGDMPPRIPGGDAPAAETRPAAPVVRIPGMDMPPPGVAASAPAPAPTPQAAAPLAQPFEPKIVSDHATPQAPIHLVTEPAVSPANPDPIAALIAAELETPAAAPHSGAESGPRPAQPASPARFSQPPRPAATSSSAPRPMPLSLAGQPKAAPATPINLKPVHAPRAIPVESDTFGVAPTAGVAKPSPRPHADDPMDEIESLIGEAVRVEMDRPAPVVTPVGGLAPRRTAPIEQPKADTTAPRSADEAILAAAAASGANVDVVEGPVAGAAREAEPTVVVPPGNRRPANVRQYVGMAVAGTLLLAAAFGLYWVLGLGRGDGTVPVLTADSSPVKVAPDPATAASTDTAATTSPVLAELDGVDNTGGETLVSTDQSTDADVAAVSESDSGLATRSVRTVTVRPDGTIVTSDDAVAGSEAMPDTRPNVPEVPGDASTATTVIAEAAEGVAPDPIAAVIANPDAAPPTTDLALVDPATTAPATPVNLDPSIPIPMPPMLNRATEPTVAAAPAETPLATATTTGGEPLDLLSPDTVSTPAAPAPTQVAATNPPPTSTPGNPAPAYVQLSAQRDEATALADARRFTAQFSNVIGDTPLEVHIVDLGAKGIWYRVFLPANSRAEANTACNNIKAAGGDCLIR
jgi:hypothetical protein